MRLIRILVAAAIIVGVPVLFAGSADATIKGPCTASGVINGQTYRASQASAVIPRTGDVEWHGAVNTGGSGKRNIEGKVYLKFPPPFGKIVVANGSWDGPSSTYANSGHYHYDLPEVLVGPKFTLFGHHAERGNVVCTGTMDIQLSGSKLKNPVLLASLVLTVLSVLNLALVVRAKAVRP
jgi:hypothetical protein